MEIIMKKFMVGKRLLSFLTVVCMLLACAPMAFAAMSAEKTQLLTEKVNPYWSSTAASVEQLSEQADGANVFKVTLSNSSAGATIVYNNDPSVYGWVDHGKRYMVDFYAKIDDSVEKDSVRMRVHNPGNSDDGSLFYRFDVTKEWQHFNGIFEMRKTDYAKWIEGGKQGSEPDYRDYSVFIGGEGDSALTNNAFYFHSFKAYELPTSTGELESTVPSNGALTLPVDKITLKFSGYMSEAAKESTAYTLTGGTSPLTITGVEEKADNTYVLSLSGKTELDQMYTLSFDGLKNWYGETLDDTEISFFSGEKVLRSSGFDAGSNEAGNKWSILQFGANDDYCVVSDVDCEDKSNSGSMKFTLKGENVAWYDAHNRITLKNADSTNLNAEAGKTYTITMKVKSSADVTFQPIISEQPKYGSSKQTVIGDNTWKDCKIVFTAFDAGVIQLATSGSDGGEYYIDNFKIATEPDPISDPFTLVSSTPAKGGACKTLDGITVKFSHELGAKGLKAESYTLEGGTQNVKEVKALGEKTYKIVFDKFLTVNKKYTLTMNISDVYGRKLTETLSFRTPAVVLTSDNFNAESASKIDIWATLVGANDTFGWDSADANGDVLGGSIKYTFPGNSPWYDNTNRITIKNVEKSIPMTEGKSYTAIMRIKSDKAMKAEPIIGEEVGYSSFTTSGSGEWETYSLNFTAKKNAGSIQLLFGGEAGAVMYFDDFMLVTDPEELTVSGSANAKENSVTLAFSNDMNEETVKNKDNYFTNASIEKIEKMDSKTFKIYFNALEKNVDYTLNYSGLCDSYTQSTEGSFEFNITPEAKLYFDATKLYLNYGDAGQYEVADGYLTQDAEKITAEVSGIENYSGTDRKLSLFVAYYENGALKSADSDTVTAVSSDILSAADTYKLSAEVTVGEKTADSGVTRELRAYLWDGETLAPVGETAVLSDFNLTVLTVAADGEADFASPMAANASITDSGADNRYVISIAPGTYSTTIEDEKYYKGTTGGWIVKPYTTLRGTSKDECFIVGELPAEYAGTAEGRAKIQDWSPVNLKETCALENLTITSENMRYPIHDEGGGTNKDAVHKIKNCYLEHKGTQSAIDYFFANGGKEENRYSVWHWTTAYGYGAASGEYCVFENTTFKSNTRAWYVHSNAAFAKPQINVLNNCTMEAGGMNDVTAESLGSGTADVVELNNCKFKGLYISYNDSPWIYSGLDDQWANHAEYGMTFNNCDPIGFRNNQRGEALVVYSKTTDSTSAVEVSGSAANVIFGGTETRAGGGGLRGFVFGKFDISGILVGMGSDKKVNNTLGRRLGDCTKNTKTLTVKFDGDSAKTVTLTFDKDYTELDNAAVLNEINSKISDYGTAAAYNVSKNEYYPSFPDKEFIMTNNSDSAITRFAAVCKKDGGYARMTSADDASTFAGIALENIVPGGKGRVLTKGYLDKTQLSVGSIANGANISLDGNGAYVLGGEGTAIMSCTNDYGWAYFAAE